MKNNQSFSKTIYLSLLAMGLYVLVFAFATLTIFSEDYEANNKVIAGTLDIEATLIEHSGTKANEKGMLAEYKTVEREDEATHVNLETEENSLFTIENAIPGQSQKAVIEIANNGSIAFDYKLSITDLRYGVENVTASTALAEQLKIVFEGEAGKVEFYLSEFVEKGQDVLLGSIYAKGEVEEISISIYFEDIEDELQNITQGGLVEFDIKINAIQKKVD